MKKLLTFAAAAVMGISAFADCGTPVTPTEGAYAYTFKASIKTVEGKGGTGTCSTTTCYRVAATKTLKGLWVVCACSDLTSGIAMWNTSSTSKYTIADASVTTGALNPLAYFGGATAAKSTKAEGFITFAFIDTYLDTAATTRTFTFYAAGFGTQKAGILKSLKGNIVGTVDPAKCAAACTTVSNATAFLPCTLAASTDVGDVASGTWSITYNAKLSKIAATSGAATAAASYLTKAL